MATMNVKKFLIMILLVGFLCPGFCSEYVQVQKDPLFKKLVQKNPKSLLFIEKTKYDKEKLAKYPYGMPVYIVECNTGFTESDFNRICSKIEKECPERIKTVLIDFRKRNKQLVNATEINPVKEKPGKNCDILWYKTLVSYKDSEGKLRNGIFYVMNLLYFRDGRFISAQSSHFIDSKKMKMHETDAREFYAFLEKNVPELFPDISSARPVPAVKPALPTGSTAASKASSTKSGTAAPSHPAPEKTDAKKTKTSSTEAGNEYYLTPPLGFFRGIATILFSPCNYLRAFPLSFREKEGLLLLPFALVGETGPTGLDIFCGTLDTVSFGLIGNEIYGEKHTPWWWERDFFGFGVSRKSESKEKDKR